MAAALEDVQLGRDVRPAQGEVELHAILRWNSGVLTRVKQECGWSFRGDLLFVGKLPNQVLRRLLSQQVSLRATMRVGFVRAQ